jgi:methylthioribose-1-phosphate isomerase
MCRSIPFFVAAPTTTLDVAVPSGAGIPIEQRDPTELTHSLGRRVAAEGVDVWNPSFDVTPAKLIAGVITEAGVALRQGDAIDVRGFLQEQV